MSRTVLIGLLIALAPSPTLAADRLAADACASKLGADPKQIYDLVAPSVTPSSVIKDIIVEKVRPLVMAGKISRDAARTAAVGAGDCLKLLK